MECLLPYVSFDSRSDFYRGELSVKVGHTRLAFKSSLSVFNLRVHPFHSLSVSITKGR